MKAKTVLLLFLFAPAVIFIGSGDTLTKIDPTVSERSIQNPESRIQNHDYQVPDFPSMNVRVFVDGVMEATGPRV
jgi:hypothetical protein